MPRSHREKPVFERNSGVNHPDYEIKETRVSDFLRRFGTGHIDDLPTTSSPEISDDRTVDEMLSDPFVPHMSNESVDILSMIEENKDRFDAAFHELELTKSQHKKFKEALSAIKDPNCPFERKREAYSVLEKLSADGKLRKCARAN